MEAQLLRDMISEREKRIEKIKRKSEELRKKELEICKQLETVTSEVTEDSVVMAKEKTTLLHNHRMTMEQLEALQRDFAQQGDSLRTYCSDVAKQKVGDSTYVMRMQAQLCKAMHSIGITDHQLDLVKRYSEAIIKYQKEMLSVSTDEKTQRELELMNELMVKDSEKRDVEAAFTTKLATILKELESLSQQIEENEDSGDEEHSAESEEEDDDEEEMKMKEEMMQMLQDRRAEIDRLEAKREEQEDLIAEMEEQLEDMGGYHSLESSPVAPTRKQASEGQVDACQNDGDTNKVNDAEDILLETAQGTAVEVVEGDDSENETNNTTDVPMEATQGSEMKAPDGVDDNEVNNVAGDELLDITQENQVESESVGERDSDVADTPDEPLKTTQTSAVEMVTGGSGDSELVDGVHENVETAQASKEADLLHKEDRAEEQRPSVIAQDPAEEPVEEPEQNVESAKQSSGEAVLSDETDELPDGDVLIAVDDQ